MTKSNVALSLQISREIPSRFVDVESLCLELRDLLEGALLRSASSPWSWLCGNA